MYIIENPSIYNLTEISKEVAFEKFPNNAIYYKKPNDENLYFRCWWHEVNNHFHEFPHGEDYKYFLTMNNTTKKLLTDYEKSVNAILKAFVIKQYQPEDDEVPEDYFETWKFDDIINIQDNYLSIEDIIFDLTQELPKHFIFEWYNFCLENQNKGYINYKSYSMGLRNFTTK